jgi:dihydrofolate synthase/folylpolyglutamate synthase
VARVIEEACHSRGARLIRVGRDVTGQGSGFDTGQQRLEVKGRLDSYKLSLPLLGQHQMENAAVAVAALEALAEKGFHISRESIINGLGGVSWPGRFQILSRPPRLVVDGAHNPDSARRLGQSLAQYFGLTAGRARGSLEPAILVIGVSYDKDIAGIAAELAPLFDRVIATRSLHPRSMAVAPIVAQFAKYGVEAQLAEDVPTALRLALGIAGEKGLVCVAGSLFVVGEAMAQAEAAEIRGGS